MTTTLDLPFQLGQPQQHPGVSLWPLFPLRDPVCDYVSLDEALAGGLYISDVDEAGDVGELAVRNPLDRGVLLYDGEELVGAKQNRILNVSVLLGAGSTARIPVSCVERGRWSWRDRSFRSAGHVAGPELRRHKAASLRANALARGAAQGTVWAAVDDQLAAVGADPNGINGNLSADGNALTQQPSQKPGKPGHDFAQIDDLGLGRVPSAEGQKLASQSRGTIGGLVNVVEQLRAVRCPGRELAKQVGIPEYDRQEVVKIVSDTARHLTDHLHLLRLLQCSFSLPSLRHFNTNPRSQPEAHILNRDRRGGTESLVTQFYGWKLQRSAPHGRLHKVPSC